jgi:hypothetical protein
MKQTLTNVHTRCSPYVLYVLLALVGISNSNCHKGQDSMNNERSSYLQHHDEKITVPFKGVFTLLLGDVITGTGEGTVVGKFEIVAEDDDSNFPFITGIVTITAANGDKIFASHQGYAEDLGNGILKLTLEQTVTGGTGRFATATGNFTIISIADTNNGTASATFSGTITY